MRIDGSVKEVAKEMEYRLSQPNCIGIAAIQLGEQLRIIGASWGNELLILLNPVTIKTSPQTYLIEEGCLSIGKGKRIYRVKRHKLVKVRALNLQGDEVTYKGRDIFGRVLQHEIDHLDGRLIIDHGQFVGEA